MLVGTGLDKKMVEPAGIEPASVSNPLMDLHV